MKRSVSKGDKDLQSHVAEKEPFDSDPAKREVVEWPAKYDKAKGDTSRGNSSKNIGKRP